MKQFDATEVPPILIDWDSIGGAASDDIVKKFSQDGVVGKGFHDKAHTMKQLCQNWSQLRDNLPIIVYAVNQEKPDVATGPGAMPGVTPMHVTGGLSQVFKAGHVISARFRNINNGAGKLVTLRTTKTSFCDPRRVQVKFVWNRTGTRDSDAQGHHWQWAQASANVLANPQFVGQLRDIADVKISAQGLVTCPQLGCKSVIPQEFQQALFDPANSKVLQQLYAYQKIEKLNGMQQYYDYIRQCAVNQKQAKQDAKKAKAQQKAQLAARKKAQEQQKAAAKAQRLAKKQAAQKAKQAKADALKQKPLDVVRYDDEQG